MCINQAKSNPGFNLRFHEPTWGIQWKLCCQTLKGTQEIDGKGLGCNAGRAGESLGSPCSPARRPPAPCSAPSAGPAAPPPRGPWPAEPTAAAPSSWPRASSIPRQDSAPFSRDRRWRPTWRNLRWLSTASGVALRYTLRQRGPEAGSCAWRVGRKHGRWCGVPAAPLIGRRGIRLFSCSGLFIVSISIFLEISHLFLVICLNKKKYTKLPEMNIESIWQSSGMWLSNV